MPATTRPRARALLVLLALSWGAIGVACTGDILGSTDVSDTADTSLRSCRTGRYPCRADDGGILYGPADAGTIESDAPAPAPADAGTTTLDAGTPTTAETWFVGDFETGDLSQWPDLHDVPPGGAQIVTSPVAAAGSRYAWKCQVSNELTSGTSVTGDSSYAANVFNWEHERPGQSTWYRFAIAFPSGTSAAFPGRFTPQTWIFPDGNAGWNMLFEFHEPAGNDGFAGFPASPYFGMHAGRLHVRWVGGPRDASTWLYWTDDRSLVYDHWYDMLFHIVWDQTGTTGIVELWVDGRKVLPAADWPAHFPTLWRYDDGSYAPVWQQLGHYRRSPGSSVAPYTDTLYIDSFRVGPSLASVGG